jgi:hypothetical protein
VICELLPFFEKWAFNFSEDMTLVHISVAEILHFCLDSSSGLVIALKLLVDDVPLVRTLAVKAVCSALNTDFVSELLCFRAVVKKLGMQSKRALVEVGMKWLSIIQKRMESDVRGEVLMVLVDEFFIVKEVLKELGVNESFQCSVGGLLKIRSEFLSWGIKSIERIFLGDS